LTSCGTCPTANAVNIADEISRLQEKVDKQLRAIYGKLTPAQKVQVARHPSARIASIM